MSASWPRGDVPTCHSTHQLVHARATELLGNHDRARDAKDCTKVRFTVLIANLRIACERSSTRRISLAVPLGDRALRYPVRLPATVSYYPCTAPRLPFCPSLLSDTTRARSTLDKRDDGGG